MNLKKPFRTTLFIVLLVIDLIFLSFLVSLKNVSNKDYLVSKIKDFDIVRYVKERDYIIESTNNLRYPIEIYNYIDVDTFNKIGEEAVNNIFSGEKNILESEKLTNLLKKSIDYYDAENNADSISHAKKDLQRFSTEVSYKINNDSVVKLLKFSTVVTNSFVYVIPYLIAIIFTTLIIVFEKKKGLLIGGVTYILYSLYLYYFDNNFIRRLYVEGNFYSYFKGFKKYTFNLNTLYTICFILGFVLLLIWTIFYIKKVVRRVKVSSYDFGR